MVRAVSALKPGIRGKRTHMMTEENFKFFTVQVIASQVRPLDIEVTDNRDLSVKVPEEGLVILYDGYLVGLLVYCL